MKRRTMERLFSGTIAGGMLVSTLLAPAAFAAPSASGKLTTEQAAAILKNLTPAQRQALEKVSASTGPVISPGINTESSDLVNVIVQFIPEPAAVAGLESSGQSRKFSLTSAEDQVEQSHKDFKTFINQLKISTFQRGSARAYNPSGISIYQEYREAFNGAAVTLPGTAVGDLASSGLVKKIWKDTTVQLPEDSVVPTDLTGDAASLVGTEGEEGGGNDKKMMESFPVIGVDKLHDEGVTGEGIKVGVLDTGIDYNHPDLTNVYHGYRKTEGENPAAVDPASVKGWDFIDNDADPMETTYKDWEAAGKPESASEEYYTSHGTHVSGTIAGQQANGVDYAALGVAPGVELYSYRVLGPYGSGANSGIIAGIDKAVQDGMDVINLSLGSKLNDPLDPTSIAINNAMLAGVVSVIAAGNDGPKASTLGTPGASALGITVGASSVPIHIPTVTASVYDAAVSAAGDDESATVTDTVYQPLTMKLFGEEFNYEPSSIVGTELEVVYAGLGKAEDFTGLDVNGKVALIARGEIGLNVKIKNAAKAGAAAALIYNNTTGYIDNYLGEASGFIPTFQILQADGESLKKMAKPYIRFTDASDTLSQGDALADFSSRGPVAGTDDIKPDLVAPGVAIFSTYPVYMNDPVNQSNYDIAYTRMSGTSMATPHVAGIAALILQKHPNYTPFDVKAALMNTSVDLYKDYSVYEVGAGRVDAYRAVHADTTVKVLDTTTSVSADNNYVDIQDITGSLNYGSVYTEEGKTTSVSKTLELDNRAESAKSYHLELELPSGAPITLSSNEVSVPADSSVTYNAELQVNQTVPNGTYEGYLHVINIDDAADVYQLPLLIRVSDKGVDYLEMASPAISNNYVKHAFSSEVSMTYLGLKSPMETIDFYLKDYNTGEVLGFLGMMDASSLPAGKDLYLMNIFKGYVYPFTEDGSISEISRFVQEGEYVLEAFATAADGETYQVEAPMILVDNTAPELSLQTTNAAGDTTALTPQVIEVNDDSLFTTETYQGKEISAIWVHANITDNSITPLQEAGYDYDQSDNTVAAYEYGSPFISRYFTPDSNGDFRFGITKEDFASEPYELRLFGWDPATVGTDWLGNKYVFLTPDTTYALTELDKTSVQVGDTFTATINMNNLKAFTGAEFTLEDFSGDFKLESMEATDQFKALAADQGATIDIQREASNPYYSNVKVKLEGENLAGIDGDVPLLTLKYKVTADDYYEKVATILATGLTVTQAGAEETVYTPSYTTDYMDFVSHTSRLYGNVIPEAFLVNGDRQFGKDYSKMNFNVYAETASGEKYTATIDNSAQYNITSIPVTDDVIKVTFKAPGHTSVTYSTVDYKIENGKLIGARQRLNLNGALAGDVNGDEVIDILDLEQAGLAYKSSNFKSDINQDGIVDDKDIQFIVSNFLKLGQNAAADAVAKDNIGGVGLDAMLEIIKSRALNSGTVDTASEQTVSASDLAAVASGAVTIEGKTGIPLKLPANAGELLKGNSLAVRTDAGTVTIPAEVLQALAAQANDNHQGNVYLTIAAKAVTPSSAETGVALTSGGVYDFNLSYKKADGEVVRLAAFPKDAQLTLSYDSSLNADLAGIYYLNEKTSAWEYTGGEVNAAQHTITANVGHFSTYGVLAYDKSFTDLSASHWAAGAIKALSAKHIVTGQSDTKFAPNAKTSRAEFVAMIVRALGLKAQAPAAGQFSDVASGAWYADEIAAAHAAGLVNGLTQTTFAPNKSITREGMAVIAMKAYEYATAKQAGLPASEQQYKDQAAISSWAADRIAEAAALSIMSGHASGLFAPKEAASRAETAQTIYNLLSAAEK
ncbi:S8 family serine peptidase [Paenibacillus sp. NFR01]|uniref:S8 family serine peptidase n=1 Tax=Paenibacillus sp. NFR01 TaxID=1566279 RepID=UPI0008C1087B|nr:S8 family serine peptidase [Paenibacillus sp. NFR01]SEU23231.1 S-layer homology domain-containing protein [Paenibacillus sp. NFR01]